MTPITASAVVSRLAIAESRQVTGILADLDDAERAVARALLARVEPTARIDPVALVADVRRRAREQAAAEAAKKATPSPLGILRYELSLMSGDELTRMRADLSARVERGEGDQPFQPGSAGADIMERLDAIASRLRSHATDDVAQPDEDLDDEPDDDEPRPQRRGKVPRRSPRAVEDYARANRGPTHRPAPERARESSCRQSLAATTLSRGPSARPLGQS